MTAAGPHTSLGCSSKPGLHNANWYAVGAGFQAEHCTTSMTASTSESTPAFCSTPVAISTEPFVMHITCGQAGCTLNTLHRHTLQPAQQHARRST